MRCKPQGCVKVIGSKRAALRAPVLNWRVEKSGPQLLPITQLGESNPGFLMNARLANTPPRALQTIGSMTTHELFGALHSPRTLLRRTGTRARNRSRRHDPRPHCAAPGHGYIPDQVIGEQLTNRGGVSGRLRLVEAPDSAYVRMFRHGRFFPPP